jgi:hypothetical protein
MCIQWKWGAAVYTSFTTDYNALAVKAGHQTACGQRPLDHGLGWSQCPKGRCSQLLQNRQRTRRRQISTGMSASRQQLLLG